MSIDEFNDSDAFDSAQRHATDDGAEPLALAAGLAAALLGGGAWAAIVLVTNTEVGFVAWALGGLVGWAMSRATAARSRKLAYAAAGFALLGLLVGKIAIFAASPKLIAGDLWEDSQALTGVVAWRMYQARELEPATLASIDSANAAGDTISDALWADMTGQATTRLHGMTGTQIRAVADSAASEFMGDLGVMGGVMAQLTLFDLLWLFLALGTAYRMMSPAPPEEAAAHEGEDDTDYGGA